jgi:murein DD-endopeptidase MepM/ murein hydrolase activator NlpD
MACAPAARKGGKMAKGNIAGCRAGGALSIVLLALLLAGCGSRFGGPAPVVNGGPPAAPIAGEMVIEPGQTLSGIAQHYHVPMQAIAEANHLSPPYRILAGSTLIIPGAGGGLAGEPTGPVAMAPAAPVTMPPISPPPYSPPPISPPRSAPLPPSAANPSPTPDRAAGRPIPLDHAASTAPAATLTPPPAGPAGSTANAPPPEPHTAPGAMAAAEPPPALPPVPKSAAPRGGTFLWPVRGHVLENFGAGPDGTHNDGINIAAPRGAPVQATNAGVVAYAGNELRGYGNLILIKHPNGWISAYAHLDLILVRTGQKVVRGQVIARVGSTGNVSAPQLHFELRRGKHPVDPRDYLTPLPSAASGPAHAG